MATTIFWPSENPDDPGTVQVPGNPTLPPASRRLPALFMKTGLVRVPKPITETVQPDIGPVRIIRRSTQRIYVVQGRILIEDAKVPLLENFYFTTLAAGTKRFNWVDPYARTTAVEMIFTEAPTVTPAAVANHSLGQLNLEMYP